MRAPPSEIAGVRRGRWSGVARARRATFLWMAAALSSALPAGQVSAFAPAGLSGAAGGAVMAGPAADSPRSAPGRGPRIRRVEISGNFAFDDRDLLRWMRQRPGRRFFGSQYSAAEFLEDLERIRRLYIGEGYLGVEIAAEVDSGRIGRGSVDLLVTIREGPRWWLLARSLSLRGPERTAALAETLTGALELAAPGPYRLRTIVADRERLHRALAARGLLDARVQALVARDDSCRTALLRYEIDTGPRARLREVRFHGLRRTSRSVVDREIAVRPHRLLRPADLDATRANLVRTGLFSDVRVEPAASDSGRSDKDLVITVEEVPSGELGAGFGYGTSDRARLSASWEHRNLAGRAWRGSLGGVLGERRRGLEAELFTPWTLGHRVATTLGAGHERVSPPSYRAERSRGSLLLSRSVGSRWKLDLGYSVEKVHRLRGPAAGPRPEVGRLGRLSGSVTRDSRDDLFLPRRGAYARVQGQWVSPRLGSDQHFARADAEHRLALTRGRFTLSSRARFGWIVPQDRARPVPVTERYFAGGEQTLRGFPEDAVGPIDRAGIPRGGRIIALAAAQLRAAPLRWAAVIAFADAGEVAERRDALALRSASLGAGGGLEIGAPFGRLRLAVAWPVTRRFGRGAQLYAGTGTPF